MTGRWADALKATESQSAGKPGERRPVIRPGLPLDWETFTERVTRLCLHQRLGTIGVGQWRPLIGRHKGLTDDQLLAEVLKLEQGHRRQDLEHHAARPTNSLRTAEKMAHNGERIWN